MPTKDEWAGGELTKKHVPQWKGLAAYYQPGPFGSGVLTFQRKPDMNIFV